MKYIILLLISTNAVAVTGFINRIDLGKTDGVTIYYDGGCPGECYKIESDQDPEVMVVSNGVLSTDPIKQQAKANKLAQEQAAKDMKKNAIKNSTNINTLKQALIDYLGI